MLRGRFAMWVLGFGEVRKRVRLEGLKMGLNLRWVWDEMVWMLLTTWIPEREVFGVLESVVRLRDIAIFGSRGKKNKNSPTKKTTLFSLCQYLRTDREYGEIVDGDHLLAI